MKTLVRLIACAAILASVQSFALAQGARFGYTATDLDVAQVTGHRVYRINLDNPGATVAMGITNVGQELEGFFSVDLPFAPGTPTNSRLFGVAETPDGTGVGGPSILVDLTQAACSPNGLGSTVGQTGIQFGTEAGSAWDHINNIVYSIASDDRPITDPNTGQVFPATLLSMINLSTGAATPLSITEGVYLDGLAFGGDGVLYATDSRIDFLLYKYNFQSMQFEPVGSLGLTTSEDSGLANYRGVGGSETNLFLVTEGEGAGVLGRLWTVNSSTGAATIVSGTTNGQIRLVDGTEVPEDLEGFDIPWLPLACN